MAIDVARSRARTAFDQRARVAAALTLVVIQVLLVVALCNLVRPIRPTIAVQFAAFPLSLLILVILRGVTCSRRRMTWLLVGGCLALQAAAVLGPPISSDDDYRYMWDAKTQLAGVDPYRYAPSDPALIRLRDADTFPTQSPCTHYALPDGCTLINRPSVHTIYPPVAQGAFDAIRLASLGGRGKHLPLQIAAGLGVLATTILLIRFANRRGSPLWPVAAWAFSPIVAVEATSNAHIEWLAALLCVGALLASRARRPGLSGALIGAAIATKLYPAAMLTTAGRRPVRAVAAACTVVGLSYVPHLIAVGPAVLGYLPAYLKEESYSSGNRYALVSHVVGGTAAAYVAPILLVVGLLLVWRRSDPAQPEVAGVTAFGLYLLVTTPNYAWYSLILVAMIAASGRMEWLWLAFAPTIQYMAGDLHLYGALVTVLGYGLAAVILVAARSSRLSVRRRGASLLDSNRTVAGTSG